MTIHTPPMPGEPLYRVKAVAARTGYTVGAIYTLIRNGRISAVTIADLLLIPETEMQRLLAEWPSANRGVSARWREYRAWKATQHEAAALPGRAA
jgi:hypothetical protein